MNISFNNAEVVEAIVQYVNNRGFNTDGNSINVEFVKSRTTGGVTADVTIEPRTQAEEAFNEATDTVEGDAHTQQGLF